MLNYPELISSYFILISLVTLTVLITPNNSKLTTNYHLNCGAPTISDDNQTWYTDENTAFASLAAYRASTTAANVTKYLDPSSIDQVICTAARIFHSSFTYSLPVSPGPKFVRVNFCAFANYNTTSTTEHLFLSLQANGGDGGSFTLLHNYSAYLHQQQFKNSFAGPVGKEFLIMVTASTLKLTFSPTLVGSLAFVNAIEIVPVPDGLYDYFNDPSVEESGTSSLRSPCRRRISVENHLPISVVGRTALETVTRLNVGGVDVHPINDTGGMLRPWYNDQNYFTGKFQGGTTNWPPVKILYTASVPEYTAPSPVYLTSRVMGRYNDSVRLMNNLTWSISVDIGFQYLVRLHYCERDPQVTKSDQRKFAVFINNLTAEIEVDVMVLSQERKASPVCMDYMVSIFGATEENTSRALLWLTLRPNIVSLYHDVILNGLEIFKLNQSDGNLAGSNPAPLPDDPNRYNDPINTPRGRSSSVHLLIIIEIVAGVLGSIVLIPLICVLVFCWRASKLSTTKECKHLLSSNGSGSSTTSSGTSSLPSHLCERFTLQQMKVATSNFADDSIIGVGGFGKVYRGSIAMDDKTDVMVAIKRLNPSSKQGVQEFHTEIQMLTTLRHVHLVSLIGYCNENDEMILVYEYMPLGTLTDHLYPNGNLRSDDIINYTNYTPMPWKLRLMTCIGAARGLHYLHTGAKRVIIHRDVKSSNILLDKNWIAKVSDFGLSKVGYHIKEGGPTYISTFVKGTIGYLDPEYLKLNKLTEKSDVYSFGVVLFEVLCARPAMKRSLVSEQVNLARYAQRCYKEDTLHQIVDPNIKDEVAPDCLMKFGEIAEKCVRDHGSERPSMEEVVWYLEFALQLQECPKKNGVITNFSVSSDRKNFTT